MSDYLNIFAFSPVMAMHILGHFVDSGIFIYLVNHFFLPRKGIFISHVRTILMTLFMAAILFFADIFSHNNYYLYFLCMLLLPLFYCILFFRDKMIVKITICLIISLLVLSVENLFILLLALLPATSMNSLMFGVTFFLRRIGSKILLFFLIRKLLLWTRETAIQLPFSCWLVILTAAIWDSLMFLLNVPRKQENIFLQILLISFFVMLPIFLLLIVKFLSLSAEKSKIATVMISEARLHNQYFQQQSEMTESLRKFRHDYKAHLFCMDALLTAQKYDELHQYLLSLHHYRYEGIPLKQYVDDVSLNILLNQKALAAEKCGIEFKTNIMFPSHGKIIMNDLNSLINNLCDNAIEASATIKNAEIVLIISRVKAYLFIEITNTCNENVQKTNPEFQSHKSNPEFHGMGIKIIKSIVEKYHGQYQISSTDSSFTTSLMLPDE